jgi:hypothetical protein
MDDGGKLLYLMALFMLLAISFDEVARDVGVL